MKEASVFIRKLITDRHQSKKLKSATVKKSMPFVLGCDLNSGPDDAAYEVLVSKDIFEPGNCWKKPALVPEEAMVHY